MAILKDNAIFVAPTPNRSRKIQNRVERIKNISEETFNKLVNTQRQGIDILWNDGDITPQEIIDELGDDAVKVFQFHGALTQFITTLASIDGVAVDLKYPTNAFTLSGNVITVTDGPFVP